jgi:uncharacterized protein YcfJ
MYSYTPRCYARGSSLRKRTRSDVRRQRDLKSKALTLVVAAFAAASAGQAQAAGCLAGAAVGGVGGHYVGKGHAVLGAVGGCLVGCHMANKKAGEDAVARAQTQPNAQAQRTAQAASSPQ